MIDAAKYIVVDHEGVETPIIFPYWMIHSDMARGHRKIVSAGFVGFDTESEGKTGGDYTYAICYGKSTSLNIASREDADKALIEKTIIRS